MPRRHEDFKDRRIFQRFSAKLSLRLRNTRSNDWLLAQTRDLSAQGLGIVTQEYLPVRTPLEIWLPIVQKGESLYTKGEVVYSEMLEPDKFRVGINLDRAELVGMSQVMSGTQ